MRVAGLAAVCQEDVLGLEVAVDDALAVHGHHGARQLPQEPLDGVLAQSPLGVQIVGQVAPVAVLEIYSI